jgi:transmembrane sensor
MKQEDGRFSDTRRDGDMLTASEWFASWQAGTADEAAFERWRSDPAHALAYARVTAAWEAAAETSPLPLEPDAADLVTRRRLIRGGIGGAITLAAGTTFVATRAYARDGASTGVGETRKLRLPDGSMVMLNTDTDLSWRFTSRKRRLWLSRGEVALDLRPGAATRLEALTDAAMLEPGRFNARVRDEALELTILRGAARAVRFEDRGMPAPINASAYRRLSFTGVQPTVAAVPADAVDAILAWQSGDIVFSDTPLGHAVAEYNRYLDQKIVVDDPALAATRVGGRFVSSDPHDFLHAVSASLGARVRTDQRSIHLSR